MKKGQRKRGGGGGGGGNLREDPESVQPLQQSFQLRLFVRTLLRKHLLHLAQQPIPARCLLLLPCQRAQRGEEEALHAVDLMQELLPLDEDGGWSLP